MSSIGNVKYQKCVTNLLVSQNEKLALSLDFHKLSGQDPEINIVSDNLTIEDTLPGLPPIVFIDFFCLISQIFINPSSALLANI